MKKYLNTLFVTTQGTYLCKDGETVLAKNGDETLQRVPIHALGGIVCFGQVSMSPYLMQHCAENSVGISFLSEYGRFLARVVGPVSGNVLLRREQYRRADDPKSSTDLARSFLIGKVANARLVIQRTLRDHPEIEESNELKIAVDRLSNCLQRMKTETDLDCLRGIEGEAGQVYFEIFNSLIVSQKDSFKLEGRNRRPPMDRVNCLLSFVYTLLMHDVRSALECVGLDPAVGFLHRDRPGRPSLALDMMEEFRQYFADRIVLSLINLGQVQADGFKVMEGGAVLMNDETRKTVLVAYQKRKQEEIMHPFIQEKVETGLLFHVQAMLLARHLRGDIDGYPPVVWK
jgi:CRISPR-associated protein Cas1